MNLTRRAVVIAAGAAMLAFRRDASAAVPIRLAVLRYGTVSWEIDVVRRHHFDADAGIGIETTEYASNQATQVALQAGKIDMMVTDWLWVARQRASGADWTFVPFSNALGALMAAKDSPVQTLGDLAGRRLGVAGSPIDKSWLILRAYTKKTLGYDIDAKADKTFGAPPLLAEQMAAGRLDAELTFWPAAAKAEAAGMHRLLSVDEALKGLGLGSGIPMVGYVFSEGWAEKNRAAIDGFITATRRARALLASSDEEWAAVKPVTGVTNDAELALLRDWCRQGIPQRWDSAEREAAAKLYAVLAEIGGTELVGPANTLPPGTFWQASWQTSAR
jgi:NitT/TauT family transport system substrate-binding protein